MPIVRVQRGSWYVARNVIDGQQVGPAGRWQTVNARCARLQRLTGDPWRPERAERAETACSTPNKKAP
jgi:hypothetical protein